MFVYSLSFDLNSTKNRASYSNFLLNDKSLIDKISNKHLGNCSCAIINVASSNFFFSDTGLIVGTVVGGLFLLCCVAFTWFIVQRIKSRKRTTSNPVPDPSQSHTAQSQQPATELTTQSPPTDEVPHSQSLGATAEARSVWPLAEFHDPKFTVEVPPRYQEQPPPPYSVYRDPPPPYPGAPQETSIQNGDSVVGDQIYGVYATHL